MTFREIERAKKSLPRWENGSPPVRTAEEARIIEELSCRERINSILIYYGARNILEGCSFYNQHLKPYERALGRDCVLKLCEEQLEDFQKAVVSYAGQDGEGISYNSIMWADEIVDAALEQIEPDLAAEGPENGTGYTLPNRRYHIFAYVDFIDDERVIVLEPNKVVAGAHEPIGGNTYILDFGNVVELRKGIDWCLSEFSRDRYGLNTVLQNARYRSEQPSDAHKNKHELEIR